MQKMDWIDRVSNADNEISEISISASCIKIEITLWDGKRMQISFEDYWAFKEKTATGRMIGDIIVQKESPLWNEIKNDTINGGGTVDEIKDFKSIVFYDEWNEVVILEILAEEAKIQSAQV